MQHVLYHYIFQTKRHSGKWQNISEERGRLMKQVWRTCITIMLLAVFAGCAATAPQVATKSQPCSPVVKTAMHTQKADNFLVIIDSSETMGGMHNAQLKLKIAKDIVTSLNQSIPDITLTGGLRSYGRGYYFFSIFQTDLLYGMKPYARAELAEALTRVTMPYGNSPMAKALNTAAAEDLKAAAGTTAVILVSDGKPTDEGALVAAENMKKTYGDKVCIYTIQIGDDISGKKLMEEIAKAGGCGFSINADKLATCAAMADFAEKVFFTKKCVDADADGVCDDKDECPGTPKGAKVNAKGCWVIEDVLFDFDKYEIKTQAYPVLDACVTVLKNNPDVRIEIQGHTDSRGTAAYNMTLSKNRANAIKQYFAKHGISAARLSTAGFGFSRPVASNDTDEGRAKNRRVELKVR